MRDSYSYDIKLTLWDMFVFLMRHEYGSFSGLFGLGVSLFAAVGLCLGWAGEDSTMLFVYALICIMSKDPAIKAFSFFCFVFC